jgi:hypothetical protein
MAREITDRNSCRVCGSPELDEIGEYRDLPRVTSDSKPFPAGGRFAVCAACGAMQKLVDADWLADISRIYSEFEIYHQSGGVEQPIYDNTGTGMPRSARVVRYLTDSLQLPLRGRLLDFGCGNGATLATFGARFPDWTLFGSELSDRTSPACGLSPVLPISLLDRPTVSQDASH